MSKQRIENAPFDKTDYYLRTQRIRGWIVNFAVGIIIAGMSAWLFFGSRNITVTGYAQILADMETCCVVSGSDIDKVKPGMTVWVANIKGQIIKIEESEYTSDQLRSLYGDFFRYMQPEKDMVYYLAYADIRKDRSEQSSYTIITDTVTPFEYFFGGAK